VSEQSTVSRREALRLQPLRWWWVVLTAVLVVGVGVGVGWWLWQDTVALVQAQRTSGLPEVERAQSEAV